VAAGANPIHEPEDKPWGVRAAFVQGPGKLIFEFEQSLGGWNPSAYVPLWAACDWSSGSS
jgi:hypothetical protein